ncbi:hypothetical protein RRG08_019954 [Elysia crispata]|uniref:Uncharacterized protein n=1 Tax=Elysia crispata TaxID=231223 RepID=A0AAE0Y897_9GAST|nr:hypothetical protein RRG08_019954 [Elysia crispata]
MIWAVRTLQIEYDGRAEVAECNLYSIGLISSRLYQFNPDCCPFPPNPSSQHSKDASKKPCGKGRFSATVFSFTII